jgi:hypothetical protein
MSAYVSIRQHTSAYVSIRQHTSAYIRSTYIGYAYVAILDYSSSSIRACVAKDAYRGACGGHVGPPAARGAGSERYAAAAAPLLIQRGAAGCTYSRVYIIIL